MVMAKVASYRPEVMISTKEEFILRHPHEFFLIKSSLDYPDLESRLSGGETLTGPIIPRKKFLMDGDSDVYSFPLKKAGSWILIGRSDDCYVIVDSDKVSRVHAKIYLGPDGKEVNIFDVSSNGTFVNKELIDRRTPITDGDFIGFSQSHLFNFYSNDRFYDVLKEFYRPKGLKRNRPSFGFNGERTFS
ncbi:MAG: FHA domain-containing protein [Nanoarchaeota archaeon]|nr:FHA domain-containing protein [Nanoarchaeota archaeon]